MNKIFKIIARIITIALIIAFSFGSVGASESEPWKNNEVGPFLSKEDGRWANEDYPEFVCPYSKISEGEMLLYSYNCIQNFYETKRDTDPDCCCIYFKNPGNENNFPNLSGETLRFGKFNVHFIPAENMLDACVSLDNYVDPQWELAYEKLKVIAEEVPSSQFDTGQQLYHLAEYLSENTVYDFSEHSQSIIGTMLEGAAVCAGYADTVQVYCDILHIPCAKVASVPEGNHVWNTVYFRADWYASDKWRERPYWFEIDYVAPSNYVAGATPDKQIIAMDEMKVYSIDSKMYTKAPSSWLDLEKNISLYMAEYTKSEEYIKETGIMSGDSSGALKYSNTISRDELAVILVRIKEKENEVLANKEKYRKLCPFTDVPDWAKPYVGYAYNERWVSGYNSTMYGAKDPVSIKALCTTLLRLWNSCDENWDYASSSKKADEYMLLPTFRSTESDLPALRSDLGIMLFKHDLQWR